MAEQDNLEFLKAKKIERGVVLDHVPGGKSFVVLRILGIDEKFPGSVTLLTNVPSTKFGLKDVIKIEGRDLNKRDFGKIAIISPYITVNVIRNFKVEEKFRVALPDVIENVVDKCPNANCVSNGEKKFKFLVEERDPVKLRCAYCEQVFSEKQLL
ncbi:MAG: aspartate carbamoyltransferase regulatory subunit [Candidatus Micrarchaeota archaeon]